MKRILSAAALVGTMLAPTFAHASVAAVSTFYFSGLCLDCSFVAGSPVTASAELNLSGYSIGDTISSANFVSFHYDGTNLIPGGFTLTLNDIFSFGIGSSISKPFPGPEKVMLTSLDNYSLMSDTDGSWLVTNTSFEAADIGTSGTYSSSPAVVSGVPEPSTWAMMLLGFGGLGFLAYRKALRGKDATNLITA